MNSYISNSNKEVYLVLSIFIIMFLFYNMYLAFANPNILMGQGIWERNLIKIEDYLFSNKDDSFVIVGSSLSASIEYENLKHSNIALAGLSSLSGLSILNNNGIYPKLIIVEINTIDKDENEKLIRHTSNRVLFYIKKHCFALRTKYQPINLFISFIKKDDKKEQKKNKNINKELLAKLLINVKKNYLEIPNSDLCLSRYNRLEKLLENFRMNGTKILFMEIPLHPEINNLPHAKFIRNYVMKNLMNNNDKWIKNEEFKAYETNDGYHLSYNSNLEYQKYIWKQIKNEIENDDN